MNRLRREVASSARTLCECVATPGIEAKPEKLLNYCKSANRTILTLLAMSLYFENRDKVCVYQKFAIKVLHLNSLPIFSAACSAEGVHAVFSKSANLKGKINVKLRKLKPFQ